MAIEKYGPREPHDNGRAASIISCASAVLSYGIVEVFGSLLLAMRWGQKASARIVIPKGAAA
jgi:hypothetical protein